MYIPLARSNTKQAEILHERKYITHTLLYSFSLKMSRLSWGLLLKDVPS